MRKVTIGIAAAIALAAAAPANAQGIWLGVPGFGIGIGTGPGYAYDGPYYDGYYGPNYAPLEGQPNHEYGSYGPGNGYVAYPYEPGVTYGYGTGGYRYAPRARDTRTYAYSPNVRTTREYSHRGTVRSDRGYRAAVHSTEVRDRRNRSSVGTERESMTPGRSAVGTERESATSRRVRSQEGSRAMARQPDSRQSKGIETEKTGTGRSRTQQ